MREHNEIVLQKKTHRTLYGVCLVFHHSTNEIQTHNKSARSAIKKIKNNEKRENI